MALTLADVRARVEIANHYDDTVVQRTLDTNVEAVERSAGKAGSATEKQQALGQPQISLPRRHTAITEVKERRTLAGDEVVLTADEDYREVGDYILARLGPGYWGFEVAVTYVPEVDTNLRDRVTLDLCQMDLEFRAMEVEETGAYKQEQKDYKARRRALLAQIREGRSPVR